LQAAFTAKYELEATFFFFQRREHVYSPGDIAELVLLRVGDVMVAVGE